MRYNLITLSASEMLSSYSVKQYKDNKWKISYRFDLGGFDHRVISGIDAFEDNAMFYQLMCILRKEGSVWNENSLQHSVIFIDFADVFSRDTDLEPDNCNIYDMTGEQLKAGRVPATVKLRWMLDPSGGVTIQFDKDTEVTFVPFDKSSSMARECRMSFIDSRLKAAMDRRLMLDMDFSSMSISLSKLYAYRGLYLTDAHRIDRTDDFRLDEETVIVLDDDIHNVFAPADSTIKVYCEDSRETDENNNILWKFKEKNTDVFNNVNPFDGEGIISPDYAAEINAQLLEKFGYEADAASFQIRFPFTKGMLHMVNFNGFFSEFAGNRTSLSVSDVFGIKRDLKKAHIIMTKSMFKCCGWLKDYWTGETSSEARKDYADPMKFFFAKAAQYNHALYVGNTDVLLRNSGRTKLNYQFLSTLDLTEDELKTLVSEHNDRVISAGERLLMHAEETETDPDRTASENSQRQSAAKSSPWSKAFRRNPAFIADPKVRSEICRLMETGIIESGYGRIRVTGECRFLSGDLLALLCFISKKLTDKELQKVFEPLEKETLYSDRFYAAPGRITYHNQNYGILRNPHLSRNEQCALRAYSADGSIYSRYFSKLTGVIMVSRNSLAPMALSGADFDGDLVKIIANRTVVNAIIRGAFEKSGKSLERKLPIAQIPSLDPLLESYTPSIPYRTLYNTFSGKVGQISNIALKIGRIEYGSYSIFRKKFENRCAECTIVTGLEIDAAKTGIHPKRNISSLRSLLGSAESESKDYFITAKEKLKEIPGFRAGLGSFTVSTAENGSKFYLKGTNRPYMDIKDFSGDSTAANIDRLPFCFAECSEKLSLAVSRISAKKKDKSACLFTFEHDDPDWKKALRKDKKQQTKTLIEAYLRLHSLADSLRRTELYFGNTKYRACIFNILSIQYDSLSASMPELTVSAEKALEDTYEFLSGHFGNAPCAEEALGRLIDLRWQYTPRENRAEMLRSILNCGSNDKFPEGMTELLTNFDSSGYKLLYFILKDIVCEYMEQTTPDMLLEKLRAGENTAVGESVYSSEDFLSLYAIYSKHSGKSSESVWGIDVAKACSQRLSIIFDKDMKEALRYVYALRSTDRNASFFWGVLPEDTIMECIYEEGRGEASEIAQRES